MVPGISIIYRERYTLFVRKKATERERKKSTRAREKSASSLLLRLVSALQTQKRLLLKKKAENPKLISRVRKTLSFLLQKLKRANNK